MSKHIHIHVGKTKDASEAEIGRYNRIAQALVRAQDAANNWDPKDPVTVKALKKLQSELDRLVSGSLAQLQNTVRS